MDLLTKLPKDIRDMIESKATMKLEWVKKRFVEICLGVDNISHVDNLQPSFLQKVSECNKKYPGSNLGAFVKFVNQT